MVIVVYCRSFNGQPIRGVLDNRPTPWCEDLKPLDDWKDQLLSEPQASCSWLSAWHYVQVVPAHCRAISQHSCGKNHERKRRLSYHMVIICNYVLGWYILSIIYHPAAICLQGLPFWWLPCQRDLCLDGRPERSIAVVDSACWFHLDTIHPAQLSSTAVGSIRN